MADPDSQHDDKLTGLLDAITGLADDVSLTVILQRLVEVACELVDAKYGALGVVGDDGNLDQFVHTGLTPAQIKKMGALPRGGGVLGVLLTDPKPVRLADLSAHPRSGGFPDHHPVMTTFLGAPIRVRGEMFGNLYLTEKRGGTPFSPQDEARIVALSALAGAAIANTRQITQLRQRERWRDAVVTLAVGLLASGSVDAAYREISDAARALFLGDGACVALAGEAPALLSASGRIDATRLHDAPVTRVTGKQPVVDTSRSVFAAQDGLWVRLDDADNPVVLGVALPHTPSSRDSMELASFARTAQLALERQRAAENVATLELLAERERIGRDLHDTVIQELFATGLSLQALARRTKDDPAVSDAVNAAVDQIDATVKQIRSTIFSLHPQPTDASVRGAVMRVVDEIASLTTAPIAVTFDGAIDTAIGERVAEHLIPVLREALTNVVKHAKAAQVSVSLALVGDRLVLQVTDDGVGIVKGRAHGHGMRNMRERAEACNGTCTVSATAGVGTTLTWQVTADR